MKEAHAIAVLALGLMCGSELNVAVFAHPTLNRLPCETHILVRASFARLLGRGMLFWTAGSTMLNPLLLLPFAHLQQPAWRLAAIAFAIRALVIPFSLVGPLPINNRVIQMDAAIAPPAIRKSKGVAGTYITGTYERVDRGLRPADRQSYFADAPRAPHSTAPPARVAA